MRIAFLVNDIKLEQSKAGTTRMAMAALNREHSVYYLGLNDLSYDASERILANAAKLPAKKFKSSDVFINELKKVEASRMKLDLGTVDALLLRCNPAVEKYRPWAQTAGIFFGRILKAQGVMVLNDPDGLSRAMNKLYLQQFPEEVRPRTLISRDAAEIRAFAAEQGEAIVLKPLAGSGGEGVFLVNSESKSNLNQMVESISRDGYVVAQEFLPQARSGDVRMLLLNATPLRMKGKYAAFMRRSASDDIRNNVTSGGMVEYVEVTDEMLHLAEVVKPKLLEDGIFFAGLDIVGDKLMEINVHCPGGLANSQRMQGPNFSHAVIEAIERKVEYLGYYRHAFNNVDLATL